jgi:hypothetical protein
VEAGFANVQLGHTYQVWSGREPETQLGAVFLQRHPSYADAARQVLGDGAEAHLARLRETRIRHRNAGTSALAYIMATR